MSFKRIKDNHIQAQTLDQFYDEVRMRDEDGQPLGYVEIDNFVIEFKRASLRRDCVEVDARVFPK